MHLAWNDRRTRQFLTNVGLTSNVPIGPDMRAAEWTHHISYSSSLIAFNVRGHDATAENIQSSKEFGISIAGEDQNVVCSVAGDTVADKWTRYIYLRKLALPISMNLRASICL
ncbi:MAG: hypothetical protein WCF46_12915 [Nitrososphaeraceae archaeon]